MSGRRAAAAIVTTPERSVRSVPSPHGVSGSESATMGFASLLAATRAVTVFHGRAHSVLSDWQSILPRARRSKGDDEPHVSTRPVRSDDIVVCEEGL